LVGLLWTSDQPVTETSEIFKLQKKIAKILAHMTREEEEGRDFTQNICYVNTGVHKFCRNKSQFKILGAKKGDMKRTTNIRGHRAKFSRHSDLAPGSFASMC